MNIQYNPLGAGADWIEGTRAWLYPRLHQYLKLVGAYSIGKVGWDQYVGYCKLYEEAIEHSLDDIGERNPIASLKKLPDKRESQGSWVVRHKHKPSLVAEGMQLHITIFDPFQYVKGMEVYAHYEDDWRYNWRGHLRGANFSAHLGVKKARRIMKEDTFLPIQYIS